MFLDATLENLFHNTKSIAIIGAKDKANQAVNMVGEYLLSCGFTIYPVHPMRKTVWGLPAYKDLKSLPSPVDIINVFRAPQYCPAHAKEVLELKWTPQCFWMQQGIKSQEAGELLFKQNIKVIEDLCIKTEHKRLMVKDEQYNI